jgi:ribosomal protein L20A (L18A)
MKKQPADAETEAYIAYGGPLVGSLGAVAVLLIAMATDYQPLYAVAQIGFFLNLINLLPIHPLDGGRIVTAISRWLWVVGLVGGLIVIVYLKSILFLLIWGLFAWELYKAFVKKKQPSAVSVTEVKSIRVNRRIFENYGVMAPGESHQRELPFKQYCRIQDQQPVVEVFYPGVGSLSELSFEKGHVHKVELHKTQWDEEAGSMRIRLTYEPYPEFRTGTVREDEYYQVSAKTRIMYGVAYFGLALALGWLMYITGTSIATPPVTG